MQLGGPGFSSRTRHASHESRFRRAYHSAPAGSRSSVARAGGARGARAQPGEVSEHRCRISRPSTGCQPAMRSSAVMLVVRGCGARRPLRHAGEVGRRPGRAAVELERAAAIGPLARGSGGGNPGIAAVPSKPGAQPLEERSCERPSSGSSGAQPPRGGARSRSASEKELRSPRSAGRVAVIGAIAAKGLLRRRAARGCGCRDARGEVSVTPPAPTCASTAQRLPPALAGRAVEPLAAALEAHQARPEQRRARQHRVAVVADLVGQPRALRALGRVPEIELEELHAECTGEPEPCRQLVRGGR